jgi:hypothetical protein
MTPEQIAAQLAKRQRDGVVLGDAWRRMKEAEAAREAVPLRRLTPAQRAALVLNAHALGMFNDHKDVARQVDEIAGRVLSPAERRALQLTIRKAAGRLLLGAFEQTDDDGAGGGGVNQLWTVRDGERVYVAWVYRKGSVLSARVTGPRRPRRRTKAPAWPLFLAGLFVDAAGRTFKCRGCGQWYGRTHGRQLACSPKCARKARRRVAKI